MSIFRKLLAIVFLTLIFVFSSFGIVKAEGPSADKNSIIGMMANWPKDNPWALAKDFCDKRSGDLMNLETWYSGKCAEGTFTLSGEGVGFVDIIQLQGLEWMFRPQYKSMPEQMVDMITMLIEIAKSITAEDYQHNFQKLQQAEINKGVIPQLGMIAQKIITTKPASSTEYLAYVGNNLKKNHIVTDTYAATPGYGFQALAPILPLWRAFRNIAYMLFAIAFILYGIMIMFRVRIDGKTAATITLAIPKLITTLLLITFSYAIVGLLVDISMVMGALLIDTLRVGKIIAEPKHDLIQTVAGNTLGSAGSFVVNFITGLLVTPFLVFNLLIGGISGAVVSTVSLVANFFTGVNVIITITLVLAVGWSYLKLILKLFQSYFSVIIALIFSPLILLGSVLPGSKAFSKWIMGIIGNLAVFPAASFLLVLSYALMVQPLIPIVNFAIPFIPSASGLTGEGLLGVSQLTESLSTIWSPPLTVPSNIGLIDTNGASGSPLANLMLATIGLGLLLMSSKYVDMVLGAFSVEPFKYGTAIGEALKYGFTETGNKKMVSDNAMRKTNYDRIASFTGQTKPKDTTSNTNTVPDTNRTRPLINP